MKNDYIGIKCSANEKKLLKKLAHKSEMTLSEYLRSRGLSSKLNNNK